MPSIMGEIVNETIKIPLDALDNFMESNYFTRILKGAFLAARARKKAALKEDRMRMEQIESERKAKEQQRAEIRDFYGNLTREVMRSITKDGGDLDDTQAQLAYKSLPEDQRAAVDKKVQEKVIYDRGGTEGSAEDTMVRDTLREGGYDVAEGRTQMQQDAGRIAERELSFSPSYDESKAGPLEYDAEETADAIGGAKEELQKQLLAELSRLISSGEGGTEKLHTILDKILKDGLGAQSPGWLASLLVSSEHQRLNASEQAKQVVDSAKIQAKELGSNIKAQATTIGDSVKEQASLFTDGLKEKFGPVIEGFKSVKEKASAAVGGAKKLFGFGKKKGAAGAGGKTKEPYQKHHQKFLVVLLKY